MDKLMCDSEPFEPDCDRMDNEWEFHSLQKNPCHSKSSKMYSLDWLWDERVTNDTLYLDQGRTPLNSIFEIFEA